VDYLDREALKEGVTSRRLKQIKRYLEEVRNLDLKELDNRSNLEAVQSEYISSGTDWNAIVEGREYTFCFMFIELDGSAEMEKRYGRKNLSTALSSFKRFIEYSVRLFNGKIWIWSATGGIVLFPFDLRRSNAVKCGFRIMLTKNLYDVEESVFPDFISFRMALHIGNTVYRVLNTGHIISDTLNYIHHLGQQYAKPGNFYLTEEVLLISHTEFLRFFTADGKFEGRKIYRMRLPIYTAPTK
jgi:hypothetical protein